MKVPSKKQYPDYVIVGPNKAAYSIEFVKGQQWLGKCTYEEKLIQLSSWTSNSVTFSTFIHELLHAIEFESGGSIKHKVIYRIEEGLYAFFLNNLSQFGFKRSKK